MKERTSIKPIYAETFSIDLNLHHVLEDHVDKTMNVIIDFDAHCEKFEQDLQLKTQEQLALCNQIQHKLNTKV